jgi:hypothetical protein
VREIKIDYPKYGFSVVYFLNEGECLGKLKGIKFEACGNTSGETLIIGLIRLAKRITTRKNAIQVHNGILHLRERLWLDPVLIEVPMFVSLRDLKLLICGREQYRNMEVLAEISWAKALTLIVP